MNEQLQHHGHPCVEPTDKIVGDCDACGGAMYDYEAENCNNCGSLVHSGCKVECAQCRTRGCKACMIKSESGHFCAEECQEAFAANLIEGD